MGVVYFSYGMTKSASSFVYQLTEEIFRRSSYRLMKVPADIRGIMASENYVETLTEQTVEAIVNWLPEGAATVIKTHSGPCPVVRKLANQGAIFASATYRDPRDIAVSLVDHGARARERGVDDFTNIVHPIDALPLIKNQVGPLNAWLGLSDCQSFSYNVIRLHPETVVAQIMEQVGVSGIEANDILGPFQDRSKIIHFHVGDSGRYKEYMTDEVVNEFNSEFEDLLAMCGASDDS